jgi:hypothetical protein
MAIYPRGLVLTLVDGSVKRCDYAEQWPPGTVARSMVYSCFTNGREVNWLEYQVRAVEIHR